jgi:hypothetical protein
MADDSRSEVPGGRPSSFQWRYRMGDPLALPL